VKILIINGSPRKGGNSDCIAQHIISKFPEITFEEWKLRETNISCCIACERCGKKDNEYICSQKDTFTEKLKWIADFDAFLFITPVYQGGVTAQTKIWMDRCEAFRLGRKLKDKICGGIVVAGFPGGGQELALMQIQYFAHITAMRYVPSLGNTRSHFGGYCIAGERKEVLSDIDGLKSCENVVSNIVDLYHKK